MNLALSRPAATTPDSDFTLTIDEALERYSKAGHPRTPRSVQRYCAKGHIEARLIETSFGEKWLITADSIDKHIAYIDEVTPATGRDASRLAATGRDSELAVGPPATTEVAQPQNEGAPTGSDTGPFAAFPATSAAAGGTAAATDADMPRQVATSRDNDSRYVDRLESENEFLRDQIVVKDSQIREMTERARETNVLIGGLQKMLTPLLGNGSGNGGDRHHGLASDIRPVGQTGQGSDSNPQP